MNIETTEDPAACKFDVMCINPNCGHLHEYVITRSEVPEVIQVLHQSSTMTRSVQCPLCGDYREYEFRITDR